MAALDRVSVVGTSGAGKSVFAAALAARLGVPHIELDGIRHLAGWTENPDFVAEVAEAIAADRWVVDGNYRSLLGTMVWERATTVVWIDYERPTVMWRVIRRSLRRMALREELWNGNREPWHFVFRKDHPIRWSWSGMHERRRRIEVELTDPAVGHLAVHRFGRPPEAAAWLASVPAQGVEPGEDVRER